MSAPFRFHGSPPTFPRCATFITIIHTVTHMLLLMVMVMVMVMRTCTLMHTHTLLRAAPTWRGIPAPLSSP